MLVSIRRLGAGVSVFVLLIAAAGAASAQAAPSPSPASPALPTLTPTANALEGLRPALARLSATLDGLRVNRWKGSSSLRSSTQDDLGSIQRDLANTLPSLMDRAEASARPSGPLAPAFALYRNVDALYDVLLRVSETANLVAPSTDAVNLEAARASLEAARGQLGNALLSSAAEQDGQLAHFRAEAVAAPRKPAVEPKTIIIDDGPEPAATKHRRRRKTPEKKPAEKKTPEKNTPQKQ